MTPTIEVAMIVKNEEELLARCLESIKGVDSCVIVDTGSDDKTIEIAKKYTDKVFTDYKWEDSFCKARNHALSKCTCDWIYSIDADEYLLSPVSEVREWAQKAQDNGWLTVDVQIESGPKDKFWYPRLFKRDPKVYWSGDIHNYLSIANSHKSTIRHHFDYSPAHQKDPDRAYRILRKVCMDNPKCVREKFYLAREYWYKRDFTAALAWYEEYIKVAYWGPELTEAWFMKAKCLWNLSRGDEARTACAKAISLNSNFKEAILFLAEMSGPGNKKRWTEFATGATNENILFIRT
jgi:glycosyltransferase involved in cell wall biosynthesis